MLILNFHKIFTIFADISARKKYSIVDELEKKTVVHQSTDVIENGTLLKSIQKQDNMQINKIESISLEEFKTKVVKLKLMKEAGLLSDDRFEEEQEKLLSLL